MKQIAVSFLFVVLAASVGFAQSATRRVEVAFTLPNGAHPVVQVHEGDMASVETPATGKVGVTINVDPSDANTLLIDVFDLGQKSPKKVKSVQATMGAVVQAMKGISIRVTRNDSK